MHLWKEEQAGALSRPHDLVYRSEVGMVFKWFVGGRCGAVPSLLFACEWSF